MAIESLDCLWDRVFSESNLRTGRRADATNVKQFKAVSHVLRMINTRHSSLSNLHSEVLNSPNV